MDILRASAILLVVRFLTHGVYCQNLALYQPTWQSTTWSDSSFGVDGDATTDTMVHSCTHTDFDNYAWWVVDLGDPYHVTSVTITNRGDCCTDRLRDFNIALMSCPPDEVTPAPGVYEVIYYHAGPMGPGVTENFPSDDETISGRYLVIQLLLMGTPLTLCEVEVFGYSATGPTCGGEVTTTTGEVTTTADEVTTTPDEVTTTPDEVTTTPDEVTTTPDEVTTTPDEVTTTPDEVTTTPDEVTTTPDEVTTTPDEVITTVGQITTDVATTETTTTTTTVTPPPTTTTTTTTTTMTTTTGGTTTTTTPSPATTTQPALTTTSGARTSRNTSYDITLIAGLVYAFLVLLLTFSCCLLYFCLKRRNNRKNRIEDEQQAKAKHAGGMAPVSS